MAGSYFFGQRIIQHDDFSEDAKMILENQGIQVKTEIPSGNVEIPTLKVGFESKPTAQWNEKFFHGEGELMEDTLSSVVLVRGEEELTITDNSRLMYSYTGEIPEKNQTKEEALAIGEEFLQKHDFSLEDMELVQAIQEGKEWKISYTMVYKDRYLESTSTYLSIEGDQVKIMDRQWLYVLEEEEIGEVLLPASKAILELMNHSRLKGRAIVEMEPAYYFNWDEQLLSEEYSGFSQGRTKAAWRVVMDDGEEIFLSN